MADPIPVAAYGRNAQVTEAIRAKLLPDFDIVHSCLDLSAAEAELPLLCAGELDTTAVSGLGSNAALPVTDRKVPKAILLGGGIPDEEVERLSELIKAKAPNINLVRVTKEDVLSAGASGPDPDVITRIYREKMAAL
ncbi:hypothetical protein NKR23_g3531 [Pleurostoma richardsiae]|uniref:Uncharacterized protein n=1 Tax=Pleurostoma richardsiae TaxID=41990 RepID=A0AA38RYJ1_9PEZI|nr:hypothetical protein NKR23_g3531 [Pleurostoma richardsiae]